MQALFDYAPRYARVLRSARVGFQAPAAVSAFTVVERIKGDATTDFGAPGMAPSADKEAVDAAELDRIRALFRACWRAFDAAARDAAGKERSKGPRGGGRDLERIVQHVLDGDSGYLAAVGWKVEARPDADPREQLKRRRQAILTAMAASARGEIARRGPRGGLRWTPRYFVRRVSWHVLDHAWEIADRVV
ncbi:MAG: hypothetical protein HY782_04420 [Chloroflexi bacterium]|nr:hypothetical protein [Chloroflexota bacterium]